MHGYRPMNSSLVVKVKGEYIEMFALPSDKIQMITMHYKCKLILKSFNISCIFVLGHMHTNVSAYHWNWISSSGIVLPKSYYPRSK